MPVPPLGNITGGRPDDDVGHTRLHLVLTTRASIYLGCGRAGDIADKERAFGKVLSFFPAAGRYGIWEWRQPLAAD